MDLHVLAQDVVQPGDDHVLRVGLHAVAVLDARAAHVGGDEELRVLNADGVLAEGPQADHGELGVPEEDGLLRAPLHVGEDLAVDVVDVGPEGRRAAEGHVDELAQERHVHGGERVAAGAEDVQGLAVPEEDRPLGLLDHELGAHLDLATHLEAVDHLLAGVVQPLDDF